MSELLERLIIYIQTIIENFRKSQKALKPLSKDTGLLLRILKGVKVPPAGTLIAGELILRKPISTGNTFFLFRS